MTDSPDAPKPKFRRRAEARPDEVLDAALALFSERGYGPTSVEAIARRAGISKGAVYLYFSSKQAILEGLVGRAVGHMLAAELPDPSPVSGSAAHLLEAILRRIVTRLSDPATLAVPILVMREAVNAPEIAQMYRSAVLDRAAPALAGLIRRGIEQGEFRPVDPDLTLRSIIGPVFFHIMLDEVFEFSPDSELGLDRLIENHLTILLAGLAAEGGPDE